MNTDIYEAFRIGYELGKSSVTDEPNVYKIPMKPVMCEDTGVIYRSSQQAAKILSINHSHISECCRGLRKTAGGSHWRYIE